MSWRAELSNVYRALIGPGGGVSPHTYDTFPDNADANPIAHVTTNTEGDYVSVVTSVGAASVWTVALTVGGPTAIGVGGETVAKFTLASGASGSETVRVVVPYYIGGGGTVTVASLQGNAQILAVNHSLPFPLHFPSGTQLWARVKTVDTGTLTYSLVETHALTIR